MIEFVDIDHAQELDAFVTAHENCHFMQTSGWGRVKSDWGWYGILCRDEQGNIVGSMALLRHNVHYLHTCMLYAPCGPIFTEGDFATFTELVNAAKTLCKKTGAYILRCDPRIDEKNTLFAENARKLGFSIDAASDFSLFQPRCGYMLDLQGMQTPDELLAQYHRTARYNVHYAQKHGVTVRVGTEEEVPVFAAMLEQIAKRNGFEARQAPYLRTLLHELGDNARLYLADVNGKTVAGSIAVFLGNSGWFMYGASNADLRREKPNELIQYQMQSDALKRGCRWFDFRGVEGYPTEDNPKHGLHQHKQSFGAAFYAHVGQLDMIMRPNMSRLLKLVSKVYHRL